MIRALVVTHGRLGEEFRRVVELFLGPVEELEALSNAGLSGAQLAEAISGWLDRGSDATNAGAAPPPAVILVDDYGGSCTAAARLATADRSDVRIVCGVNLAMLLGFVSWRDTLGLSDLARRMVNAGRGAIVQVDSER